jgi:hypothetical protein
MPFMIERLAAGIDLGTIRPQLRSKSMRSRLRFWPVLFLFTFSLVLIPSGRLLSQQPTGKPSPTESIDQLTAPIALYPDALIFQIMPASTNIEKVKSFAAWLGKNAKLKGSELQDAAQKAGFDAPYVALAPFPQVVQMMAQKPEWTKALGQAFTVDKNAIFDSVQRLRAQAQASGNLRSTPEQKIETQTTSNGQQVIVIQPANPEVIYVPTYNPQTVYVAAPPPPPSGSAVAGAAALAFTTGVIIGASQNSYNSYYHAYDDYWDDREDYYQERQENYQENASQRQENYQENASQRQASAQANQDQRQANAQANQDQRQSNAQANQAQHQANQDQRQSNAQANQAQRQSTAQANQAQRASTGGSAQSPGTTSQSQRQTAAATSSRTSGQTASQRTGMSSSSVSGYQSGSTTRAESARGNSSLSSSRSAGRGGRRSGGGGRRNQ